MMKKRYEPLNEVQKQTVEIAFKRVDTQFLKKEKTKEIFVGCKDYYERYGVLSPKQIECVVRAKREHDLNKARIARESRNVVNYSVADDFLDTKYNPISTFR
jgi:hypothetical protein